MLGFKPAFSRSSFTFIKKLFSSFSLSAIRLVSSTYWYFSQQSWFQLVLHPAWHFAWCTLHMSQVSRVTYTALTYSFPNLEPVYCSMSSSNGCFLTCIQISQEASKVVCYSHLLKNFTQFFVIHTVKGFGIVNKAEIDVFWGTRLLSLWSKGCWKLDLWLLCLF